MNLRDLDVRVIHKTREATDICVFELAATDGGRLPAFSAGSHIDVHLPSGLTRQYSLCNSPTETHRYVIGVLKDPASRGGSSAMHELVQAGDIIRISSPRNHFQLAPQARRSLLLAGGIGITPLLCMAESLALSAAEFELHYCVRNVDRMAFKRRIETAVFADRVRLHFDDGPPSQAIDLKTLLSVNDKSTHLYVCGPGGFMNAVLETARQYGWPESQLHYEFFSADVAPSDTDADFEVQLASSGRVLTVPKGVTVVQALAAAGLVIPTSCEQGVCGTCVTGVLDGQVEHRDLFLTPEEQARNNQFTPCCSRARSARLLLDL